MILRNFLFLDTKAVNDHLGTVEGSLLESLEQTEMEKRARGGRLGINQIIDTGASAENESSKEIKQTRSLNEAAKFQRLYDLLKQADSILQLDAFNPKTCDKFSRGQVLEIEATTNIPKLFLLSTFIDELGTPYGIREFAEKSPDSTEDFRQWVDTIYKIHQMLEKGPVPLLFEATNTSGFHFFSSLPRQHLLCKPAELNGDMAVFGTVQRVIPPGKVHQFSLVASPLVEHPYITSWNKTRNKGDQPQAKQEDDDNIIKGPAIILSTIAIYR